MKVVYIVNSDLGKHGSIGFRTFEVAQEAFKRGFLKRVICRGNFQDSIPKELIKFSFLHRIFSLGLEFLRMYFFNKFNSYKLNFKSFEFFVSQKMLECDVCHSYELTEKLIRSLKKKSKILIYDTQMGLSIDKNDKKAIKKFLSYFKFVDFVFASSEFVKKSFLDIGFPKSRINVFNYGVDIKKFKKIKSFKKSKFTFLFVGILGFRKGVDFLLKAWSELGFKDAELFKISPRERRDVAIDF